MAQNFEDFQRNARKRSRTFTGLPPRDFKSLVSTIPPSEQTKFYEDMKYASARREFISSAL